MPNTGAKYFAEELTKKTALPEFLGLPRTAFLTPVSGTLRRLREKYAVQELDVSSGRISNTSAKDLAEAPKSSSAV